ncbi:MAG: 1-(5-phosphoribosyl)-5-[(5-phosphoribosylamino)methylideneamino]imidazole-4-carboxamide isomerase [Candidatus Izemoplasmataceae bacterium]
MILLPAIDLQNKSCVRLTKGDFDKTITYSTNPLKTADTFIAQGAEMLHIIDLDGANQASNNRELIINIAQSINIPIQVGGGIRDLKTIESLLNSGVARVIVGTMPFSNKQDFISAVKTYKERIVVSLDCENNLVKINGWKDQTSVDIFHFVKELEELGIDTIVVTDIAKDGMLEGTNMELYKQLKAKTSLNIIASGGVTSLKDIEELSSLNIYGAIIGKALYEGTMNLKEALLCSQNASSLV